MAPALPWRRALHCVVRPAWNEAKRLVEGHARPENKDAADLFDFLADGGFDIVEFHAMAAARREVRRGALAQLEEIRERLDPDAVPPEWFRELDATL